MKFNITHENKKKKTDKEDTSSIDHACTSMKRGTPMGNGEAGRQIMAGLNLVSDWQF